jgi:phosphatidylglycerophosphate synthase
MAGIFFEYLGFICVIIAHCLIMLSGDFGEVIPPFRLFLFGILLLAYQTLDNLDGKQARKTSRYYII